MKLVLIFCVLVIVAYHGLCESSPNLKGHHLIQLSSDNQDSLVKTLHSLGDKVDVLYRGSRSVEMVVGPEHLQTVQDLSKRHSVSMATLTEDLDSFLKEDFLKRKNQRKKRAVDSNNYVSGEYWDYPEIESYISKVKSSSSKANIDVQVVKSDSGNNVYKLKLSSKSYVSDKKPVILIDAGIHAREWLAPSMAMHIINELAYNPSNSASTSFLLEEFDWAIIPSVNPDGYIYSRSSYFNRMWRKNRKDNPNTNCEGVDLNRNFGFDWNPHNGASTNPCMENYAGTSSFSEVESRNVRDWMLENKDRGAVYFTIHSWGEYLLYPFGSSTSRFLDNKDLHESFGNTFKDALSSSGHDYTVMNSAALYPAAGGSDDYAKGTVGIPLAYTLELSPKAHTLNDYYIISNFFPDQSLISRTVQDTWAGIQAYALHLQQHFLDNSDIYSIYRQKQSAGECDAASNFPACMCSRALTCTLYCIPNSYQYLRSGYLSDPTWSQSDMNYNCLDHHITK